MIPFGSMIEDHPIFVKDMSRLHQLGKKVHLEYSSDIPCTRVESGKGTFWSQTLRSWKRMNASEIHARRLNAKDVITPQSGDNFMPDRRWKSKIIWRDQDLRTSTLMRDHPKLGEEREDLLGESEGSHHHLKTHFQMPGKCEMISGPFQETSFAAITLNQESNFTRREKNHSQFHHDTLT